MTIINVQAVDTFLDRKRRSLCLPSLSAAIVHNGTIVYLRGQGAAGPGRIMTPQTPLIIGSLSKSFTALAMLQLVERGLLALDDPIQKHIPWFRLADLEGSACITIRHVLTHTSGISRYAGRELLASQGGKTLEQSVRDLRKLRLSRPVGSTFQYSNLNYAVAGLVIEVVSGQSFSAYIQEHILTPLGMRHTFVSEEAARRGGLATGYRWWFGVPVPFHAPYVEDALPAAFVASCAEDMGRYLLALLNSGTLEGTSILSPDGVKTLLHPHTVTASPGSSYALGWRVEQLHGMLLIRHGGEVSNFIAEMALVPERSIGVVVLANGGNGLVPLAACRRETSII